MQCMQRVEIWCLDLPSTVALVEQLPRDWHAVLASWTRRTVQQRCDVNSRLLYWFVLASAFVCARPRFRLFPVPPRVRSNPTAVRSPCIHVCTLRLGPMRDLCSMLPDNSCTSAAVHFLFVDLSADVQPAWIRNNTDETLKSKAGSMHVNSWYCWSSLNICSLFKSVLSSFGSLEV